MNDITLPADAEAIAARCTFLDAQRRDELLTHFRTLPQDRLATVLGVLVVNDTNEGRFVRVLLGKEQPDKGGSPDNKKLNPPETK